ncbi:hypothetical protein, partial [Escherichia coli]
SESELYLKAESHSASVWIEIAEQNFIKFNKDEIINHLPIKIRLNFNYGTSQITLPELKEISTGDVLLLNSLKKQIIYME